MPSADDPSRLLDDPAESADLRRGLERMSRDLPDAEVMARLAARLGIAEPPPAPPNADLRATALKFAAGAGIVGLGLFATVRAMHVDAPRERASENRELVAASDTRENGEIPPGVRPARRSAERRVASPAAPSTEAVPNASTDVVSGAAAPLAVDSMGPPGAPAPRAPSAAVRELPREPATGTASPSRPSEGNTSSAPSNPPSAAPPSETELLRDARLVLGRDPSQALALSEQHRRLYPSGTFTQEREVIAITALARLGRTDEARTRAERFERAFPKSPYRQRIDAVLSP